MAEPAHTLNPSDFDNEETCPNIHTVAVPRWFSQRRPRPRMLPTRSSEPSPVTLVLIGPCLPHDVGIRLNPQVRIGRAVENELGTPWDGTISRRHCRFVHSGGKVYLEDLGSRNGTFVNGERVDFREIKGGEEVRIGDTAFVVAVLRIA